ncbi:metalloendoproteinase 2-MMP [Trifolium repens]|nr:metalloendoproteinase 2-MMP [Trifolium repens]
MFLLLLSFLFADVSESISIAPAIGLISRSRIPFFLKRIISSKLFSSIWNKFKSIFNKALKIGDIANGISDLKEYLQFFGYLNYSSLRSNFTDEFTENLQSGIIKFQRYFNLSVTGQLDKDTYNIISQPRCGVPDIVNGTTKTLFKPWWRNAEKKLLTYSFHPENNVTDDVKSLFQDAFNRWSNVTSMEFTETASFNGSDIHIVFLTLDGKGGTVGGGYINNSVNVGSIYLDAEEQWVLSNNEDVDEDDDVDLESVVMHEIGHLLGLGHSYVKEAIMYPIVLPEKKIELVNDDDLQRIRKIYGVNTTSD